MTLALIQAVSEEMIFNPKPLSPLQQRIVKLKTSGRSVAFVYGFSDMARFITLIDDYPINRYTAADTFRASDWATGARLAIATVSPCGAVREAH